jgi:uncharacterized NAD(P)/FAD-binding protein YdhS
MTLGQQPQSVVIIGGGLSGALVALQLLQQGTRPLRLSLVERRHAIGRGVAYSSPLPCHLLNVPVNGVSLVQSEPDHFLHWLHRQGHDQFAAHSFVPRYLFGSYVQAALQGARQQAAHAHLDTYRDEAVDLVPGLDGVGVGLGSGQLLLADRVVLALGNPAPGSVAIPNGDFYQSHRYIDSGWSGQLDAAMAHDRLLLMGMGLTAIDWVVALHSRGYGGEIHLLSRHGLLPQPHTAPQDYDPAWWTEPPPQTTLGLLRWVRRQVDRATQQGYGWRAVLDSLRYQGQALWVSLPLAEKQRFVRHLRPYWDSHRHRIAPEIGEVVAALRRSQQLQLHSGHLVNLEERGQGVAVTVRPRGQTTNQEFAVEAVINCTGPQFDYAKLADPLVRSLLTRGLISPDPLRLGLQASSNGAVYSAQGIPSPWLYTLGPPRRGELWETTAVAEIRDQATALAQALLGVGVTVSGGARVGG